MTRGHDRMAVVAPSHRGIIPIPRQPVGRSGNRVIVRLS